MKTLVCLGDSITDAGRLDSPDYLGFGYVKLLSEKLYCQEAWRISNRGVDGFTVMRLLENVDRDCCCRNPDVVTILIGINDIGLMMNTNRTASQQQEMLLRFQHTYATLLQTIRQRTQARIILMEPFIFPWPLCYALWKPFVQQLSDIIQQLSQQFFTDFLPLQQPLLELASREGYPSITTDGVHLTARAHAFLAEQLLNTITNPYESL